MLLLIIDIIDGRFHRNTLYNSKYVFHRRVVTILASLTVEGPSFVHETYQSCNVRARGVGAVKKSIGHFGRRPAGNSQFDRHYIIL